MIRRIRSSRSIEYQIEHSVDFMRLVSGRTISDFRREHKKELKDIHRQILRVAIDMGVAKLSELCIDGTRVRANASRHKTWAAERIEQLVREHVSILGVHDSGTVTHKDRRTGHILQLNPKVTKKALNEYEVVKQIPAALESVCKDGIDTWSIQGESKPVAGGGWQYKISEAYRYLRFIEASFR